MKLNKLLLTFIIGIFLISSITASDYLGTQWEDINIVETCTVNGFPCPNDFLCNITISNPNNELIVLNSPMTRNDTIYNYTFLSTDYLGDYDINIYCDNVTLSGNSESSLTITTTGQNPNLRITIFLLVIALGIFMLALHLKSHAIGFISGVLFSITGTYLMIYGLGDVADMYTRAIALVVLTFGIFVTLVSSIEWLEDLG